MRAKLLVFIFAFCMSVCSVDALKCDYSVPSDLTLCNSSIAEVFANVSTECCPRMKELVNVVGVCLAETGLSRAASIIDYCGIGGWLYLAARSLLKAKCSYLQRDYVLQSPWQKVLSSEWMAFGLTFCSAAAFIQLGIDLPTADLIVSIFAGGIPAAIGAVQFVLDVCKGTRWLFRKCLKWCLPRPEQQASDNRKLREALTKERNEIDERLRALQL
jgi:hypothetical protein